MCCHSTKTATFHFAWDLSQLDERKGFLVIDCEGLADAGMVAAAVWVLGCWEARKDLQLTLGVFLEKLRGYSDDMNSGQIEHVSIRISFHHPYLFGPLQFLLGGVVSVIFHS